MDSTDENVGKVSDFWGDEKSDLRKHNWLEHPVARACINFRASGDVSIGVVERWRHQFFSSPVPLALSVGCGFGSFERAALSMGLAERFEATDLSAGAIEQAKTYAAEAGLADRVTYTVADLNRDSLPAKHYDAIFGISSVHHISALERFFGECRNALKPGGLLLLDEYVGPARFQSKAKVVRLINEVMTILPDRYRNSVYLDGQLRQSYQNPPISWFEENDPSEAIRSDEIIDVLKMDFEIIEMRSYGGALLHMLLSGTAGNYNPGEDADVAILRILALMEETLEEAGVLGSDFAAIVARPK